MSLDNNTSSRHEALTKEITTIGNEINQLKNVTSSTQETLSQEIAILKSTSEHNSEYDNAINQLRNEISSTVTQEIALLKTTIPETFDIENTTRAYQEYKKNLSDEVDRLMMVQSDLVFDEKSVGVGELASYAYKQSQQALKLIKAYNDAILNVQPVMAYFGEISGAIFDARFNHVEANNRKYIEELLKPYLDKLERPA